MCFVWISEQTAIISLYSINWLVCITETECLLRGTDWVFVLFLILLFSKGLKVSAEVRHLYQKSTNLARESTHSKINTSQSTFLFPDLCVLHNDMKSWPLFYFILSPLSRIFSGQPGNTEFDSQNHRQRFSFSKPLERLCGPPSLMFTVPGILAARKDAGGVKLFPVRCSTEAKNEWSASPHIHLA